MHFLEALGVSSGSDALPHGDEDDVFVVLHNESYEDICISFDSWSDTA